MPDKKQSISFKITNDKTMLALNKEVFDHSYQTDVITLPIHDVMDNKEYLGEIVINKDQVTRNAEDFGVSYHQELARVVAHGVLHLMGHTDDSEQQRSAMKVIEDAVVEEIDTAA